MHVFVTGATGFVGFHTVMALHSAGHTVRLGIRDIEKMRKLYAPHDVDISDYAIGEITDANVIDKALDGCDAVVHTAAMVSLDGNHETEMRETNLTGTRLVVGGAVAKGIKSIVYVSSVTALYSRDAKVITEDTPLGEPGNAYGKSKRECEEYVRGLIEEGASIAISYPSAVIGPDDPAMSEGNSAIVFFFRHCFVNVSTGLQLVDVRDLAQAHTRLIEGQKAGRYLVTAHYIPWRELGDVLDKVTRRKLLRLPIPCWVLRFVGAMVDLIGKVYRIDTPISREAVMYGTEWVYADDTKIRNELGMEYRSPENTMGDTVKWLAEAGHIDRKWGDNL